MSIQEVRGRRQAPADPLLERLADGEEEAEEEAPKPLVEPFSVRTECWTMFLMGWPMVVSFACRMAMASTDTAFVGHLDNSTIGKFLDAPHSAEAYLAAGSLSDMVTGILIVPPLAFNQVLNALVGQALGSGNKMMAGTWLQLSVFFLTISYVPFLVIQYLYVGEILHLLGFNAEVCQLACLFARWSLFWPIPNGIYQCMRFYFQAQGISRPAMWNNLAFVFVNGGLNWLLVFGGPFQYLHHSSRYRWHGFGFVGSSMSLSASRCLQPLAYWLYMFAWRGAHKDTWPGLSLDFLRCDRVKKFFAQALPLIGSLIFQSVSGQVTTLFIAQLGPLAIAASSAVSAASQVASSGLSAAFTAVAAVRVGYHLGRGDAHAAHAAMWIIVLVSTACSLLIVFSLWPLAGPLCSLVTDDPDVRPVAATLIAASFVQAGLSQLVGIGTSGVLGGQGRTLMITILSFCFELPASIGGIVIMVVVLKWRMPDGLLRITWVNAGLALLELVIVGAIVLCGNWARYAKEARERQEAAQAEATTEPLEVGAQEQEAQAAQITSAEEPTEHTEQSASSPSRSQ